ncbi:MAG: FecR domain-containing protein [Mucilaginibacter sp.]
MSKNKIADLLARYQNGECTPEEKALVDEWFAAHGAEHTGIDQMNAEEQAKWSEALFSEIKATNTKNEQLNQTNAPRRLWPRIAAAASILLMLSVGGYFVLHKKQPVQLAQNHIQDIKPGSNKAILTLANGRQISLTDAKSGLVAQQAGIQIKKTAGGKVVYVKGDAKAPAEAATVYNTITNPKGGETAAIELPDGSKVTLDAGSSITYPVPFTKHERLVTMTGEAYFEPVHNAASPFRVKAAGQITEDIGTQFNINAYDDEAVIRTTLVEGSIKVVANNAAMTLKPGQQSMTGNNQPIKLVKDADLEEALAWKNGVFVFNNAPVQEIMKQIARWYDADIAYQGDFSAQQYSGSVSRYGNVSDVLKIMQSTGAIHFKIEGRRITVMP